MLVPLEGEEPKARKVRRTRAVPQLQQHSMTMKNKIRITVTKKAKEMRKTKSTVKTTAMETTEATRPAEETLLA